jgi:D-3-phosphoglycerate dehydrogenase
MKAVLTESIHPNARAVLEGAGFEVTTLPGSPPPADLLRALEGAAILGIRSRTRVTRELLELAPDLLAVGAYCIGTNQVDLEAASLKGVAVFNAPFSNTRSVAELVIAEIIVLLRRLYDKVSRAHQGVWDKSTENAREVRGKKLGIIGFGNIGSQISTMAEAMGMDVYYHDIVDKLTIGNATRVPSLEQLLRTVDIVTIHVDGSPANTNLIGGRELALMKDGVLLLNLSRGHVVDLRALAEALRSGKVAGAAIDVFPDEPQSAAHPFESPLQGMPNVLLTPHIGGSTEEAQENIASFVSQKLLDYVATGNTFTSVNFPRINLPPPEDTSTKRLLHVHQNVPGVLSNINGILGGNNVNVVSQALRTNELIGYAIADMDSEYRDALFTELQQVPHAIRVRIL